MTAPLAARDAVELARALVAREVSAVEVAREHLARIERLDAGLGAFVAVARDAEEQAARIDRRRASGERLGPLAGLPIAVKDNLAVRGIEMTCGSRILRGFVPHEDAAAVARARSAGAVVIGKTNLDEFGMGSSTERSAFGPTRNPWDPGRVPGGSSGGSAVAVAAGLAPLALGSDTGGSVRQPAALCGVVGLKPTWGRVSRRGLAGYASSFDQVGVLARSVRDAALLLGAVAGHDPRDATSSEAPIEDGLAACDLDPAGLRVGMPRECFEDGLDREISAAVRLAAEALERAGARVEEVSLPLARQAVAAYYLVATAEASSNLARYDGVRYGARRDPGRGAAAMVAATRGGGFGPEVKRRIVLGTFALQAGYHDRYYGRAMRVRARIATDLERLHRSGIDVMLTPTSPTAAFEIGARIDDPVAMYLSDVYTVTPSLAGVPAISVPVGTTRDGLPVGAQLIGPAHGEALVLRAAAAVESALGRTPAPQLSARPTGEAA